ALLPLQRLRLPAAGADLEVPEPLHLRRPAGCPPPVPALRREHPGRGAGGGPGLPLPIRPLRQRRAGAGDLAPGPAADRSRGEAVARSVRPLQGGQLLRLAARAGRGFAIHDPSPPAVAAAVGPPPGPPAFLPPAVAGGPPPLRPLVRR